MHPVVRMKIRMNMSVNFLDYTAKIVLITIVPQRLNKVISSLPRTPRKRNTTTVRIAHLCAWRAHRTRWRHA
jgi:hypothetical protein